MRDLEELYKMRGLLTEQDLQTYGHVKKAAQSNRSYNWLIQATQPIKPDYTENTFKAGDRVRSQLQANLRGEHSCEFDYQGSVTSDTHINEHSDIDLLTINGGYITYPGDHPISNPVSSEEVDDALITMRGEAEVILRSTFPAANIDATGGKSIKITGGSLGRDVDVVFCNWWNSEAYLSDRLKSNRGIKVLDAKSGERIGNFPFLHNLRIHQKDVAVDGSMRKVIRLLKTLKYTKKPNKARISSYDITALAYNMPSDELTVAPGQYLKLAERAAKYLRLLSASALRRDALKVPNGTRKIFSEEGAKLEDLIEIADALDKLLEEIASHEKRAIYLTEAVESFEKQAAWHETRASRVQDLVRKYSDKDS